MLSIVDEYKQSDSAIITMKERELQNKSILVLGDGGYYSSEPEAATNKVYKSRSTKDDTKSKKTEVAKGKKSRINSLSLVMDPKERRIRIRIRKVTESKEGRQYSLRKSRKGKSHQKMMRRRAPGATKSL